MTNKSFYAVLALLFIVAFTLTGCKPGPQWNADQTKRAELFERCLSLIPKGPTHVTNSNDWDEVVDECGSQAYRQSMVCIKNCKGLPITEVAPLDSLYKGNL